MKITSCELERIQVPWRLWAGAILQMNEETAGLQWPPEPHVRQTNAHLELDPEMESLNGRSKFKAGVPY